MPINYNTEVKYTVNGRPELIRPTMFSFANMKETCWAVNNARDIVSQFAVDELISRADNTKALIETREGYSVIHAKTTGQTHHECAEIIRALNVVIGYAEACDRHDAAMNFNYPEEGDN